MTGWSRWSDCRQNVESSDSSLTEFVIKCKALEHALVHQGLLCGAVWDQFVPLRLKLALSKTTTTTKNIKCIPHFIITFLTAGLSPPGRSRQRRIHSECCLYVWKKATERQWTAEQFKVVLSESHTRTYRMCRFSRDLMSMMSWEQNYLNKKSKKAGGEVWNLCLEMAYRQCDGKGGEGWG